MDIRNDIKYILAKEGYTLTRIAELMAKRLVTLTLLKQYPVN